MRIIHHEGISGDARRRPGGARTSETGRAPPFFPPPPLTSGGYGEQIKDKRKLSARLKGGLRRILMKRNSAATLALVFFAFVLLSCASVSTETSLLQGAPHLAPTDPASVQILRSEPGRPYERLGEVSLRASGAPGAPEIEEKLQQAAARMGADAIIESRKRKQVQWSGGCTPYVQSVETITAVAIKYTP
jgi:hypothetical protein